MRVFLTGATGFIGAALVDRLRVRKWEVTALVRSPQSAAAQALKAKGVTLAAGDVTDRASLRAPMQGAGCVIHNAGWYELGIGGGEAERRMQAINVDGTRNTLEEAHALGVPRIVHVSSIVAYGESGEDERDESAARRSPATSVYERTKVDAHAIAEALAARGGPVVIAMPGAVVGPGDHANLGILQRLYVRGFAPPLVVGNHRTARSYVHVDDVAEGIVLAAERGQPGRGYFLCTETLTYAEIGRLWAQGPGGMKMRGCMPQWMAMAAAAAAEPAQRLLGLPNLLSREAVRGAYANYRYSGARARRELGWQPGDMRAQWLETLAQERAAHG